MDVCMCPGNADEEVEEEEEERERRKETCSFQEVTKIWHAVQNTSS